MSDDIKNHGHLGHEAEFEHEDLGTRGVFAFLIGMAVTGVVIYFIIVGMYSFLDRYERSQMTTASPLAPSREVSERHIPYAPGQGDYVEKKFKDNGAPMLEIDERTQLRGFLTSQEDQLNSYGWVDEKAGMAHIPIERAMDLIVQQGLPVYSQGRTEATAKTETDTETTTKKEMETKTTAASQAPKKKSAAKKQ
jgi:hypothetical protein